MAKTQAHLVWLTLGAIGLGAIGAAVGVENKPRKAGAPAGSGRVDFESRIQPIFAENCLACHGPDKAKGGLKLTDRNSAIGAAKSGKAAVVPGKPQESELIRRVTATDLDDRMPPEEGNHQALKPAEIEALRRWIAQGAEWTDHWAFTPIRAPAVPAVKNTAWVRNPIDAFVLAKLQEHDIAPSPEADRHTLIKRLYYDLLGLPPELKAADAFIADASPDAYERLVDRLLASPHFGERWGRHWLDMARYADSDGYEKDRARPDAYVYRDWVINAVNDDLPFDRFTIEQIAGDLLPQGVFSQKIATAFNRQTLTNEEGGVDQEEYRIAAVFDRTETLGTVWLGLTVGCARCHNHKYDPISQADYYSLFAFFNDADETVARLPVGARDMDELEQRLRPLEIALAQRKRELAPQQARWEAEQRDLLLERKRQGKTEPTLADAPLEITAVSSSAPAAVFTPLADGSYAAAGPAAEKETYTVTAVARSADITGFRLEVIPHGAGQSRKTVGRSSGGNFVLNTFKVERLDSNGAATPIELRDAQADFEQATYPASKVNSGQLGPGGRPYGWGVSGKTDVAHQIRFRTAAPINPEGATLHLRFTLGQEYGTKHTLSRFKLVAVTGEPAADPWPKDIASILEMYPEKRVASNRQKLFDYYADRDEQVRALKQQIESAYKELDAKLMDVRVIGTSLRPRASHIFDRGDFLAPAAEVAPAMPAALPRPPAKADRMTRLDLARWIVSPQNPVTRRVAVNHVWKQLLGEGLVRTVNDFGVRGERPSHPELLDWLADQFLQQGWSRKKLIRTIVTSATYRQSSAHRSELADVDPLNVLLARQARFRVEGEIVRDITLAVGGLLSRKIGGPSVYPAMPPDIAKLSYANNFKWTDSTGEDKYRRGMYTFFKRTAPHPSLMTFDCPDANVACVDRGVSNTPLQALAMLNNEAFHEAAQAMARRVLTETASMSEEERLAQALRICVLRPPRGAEVATLQNALASARAYYAANHEQARQLVGKLGPADIEAPEAAAWIATLRVILNLDEFITRE